MSNFDIVNPDAPIEVNPDVPQSGGAESAISSDIPLGLLPIYLVCLVSSTNVLVGTNGPMRFSLARKDGVNCDVPAAATVTITLPDGTTANADPTIESLVSAPTLYLDVSYLFTQRGLYTVTILVTFPDETIAGTQSILIANN